MLKYEHTHYAGNASDLVISVMGYGIGLGLEWGQGSRFRDRVRVRLSIRDYKFTIITTLCGASHSN